MTTDEYAATLANEKRLALKREERASARSERNTASLLAQRASKMMDQANQALEAIQAEIDVLESAGGPGVTSDFGEYSTLEQAMRAERFAGKSASIDYVKANPECAEEEAKAAYVAAALAARPPNRQWLLIDPASLRQEYAQNLVDRGLITDTSWESWRFWVIATDKDTIMGIN